MNSKLAHILSTILHPLLMPTYGVFLFFFYTYLFIFPPNYKYYLTGLVFIMTGLIPALCMLAMFKMGMVSNHEISNREERMPAYLFTISSYLFCIFLLYRFKVPIWVTTFIVGGTLSIAVNMIITRWWKISAHLTGIGAVVGSIYSMCHIQQINPMWMLITSVVLSGALGTARISLKQHTLGQVVCGFICGFTCVFCSVYFSL
ncbi:MAG: hypothetical protein ACRCZM_10465 [Bacteroidales bacterium]